MYKTNNKDLPILEGDTHTMRIVWSRDDKLGIYIAEINETFVIGRPKKFEWDTVVEGDLVTFRLTTKRLINNGKPVVYGSLHLDSIVKKVRIKTVDFEVTEVIEPSEMDELTRRVEELEKITSRYKQSMETLF